MMNSIDKINIIKNFNSYPINLTHIVTIILYEQRTTKDRSWCFLYIEWNPSEIDMFIKQTTTFDTLELGVLCFLNYSNDLFEKADWTINNFRSINYKSVFWEWM